MGNKGNGFDPAETLVEEAFKGATLRLGDLKGEDGIITKIGGQNQSLYNRLITADIQNIANEFKTALYGNTDEADNAVSAYMESIELGLDPTPIILQVLARSSGKNHELIRLITQAMSTTTFSTNYQKEKYAERKNRNSPLSA